LAFFGCSGKAAAPIQITGSENHDECRWFQIIPRNQSLEARFESSWPVLQNAS
jgi:hypothetical protein